MPGKSATADKSARRGTNARGVKPLVIKRTFNAPRDRVWKAWSDLEQAKEWWGPNGFTLPFLEMDQRPGGKWRAIMRTPDGKDMGQHGVYREIVPPEKTVYTYIWDSQPQHEMLVTVVFAERASKTDMTFRQEGFGSTDEKAGHEDGWNQTFDRLSTYLATHQGGKNARR